MPAGATYKRLHDVIQNVTNFQSGHSLGGYHLFEFDLKEEKMIVTDNYEAYIDHQRQSYLGHFFSNSILL